MPSKIFTGDGQDVPDSKFISKQLKMGIKIEKEHTSDPKIAKRIAKDHLMENPRYYTYLNKMEKQMDIDSKKQKRKRR